MEQTSASISGTVVSDHSDILFQSTISGQFDCIRRIPRIIWRLAILVWCIDGYGRM